MLYFTLVYSILVSTQFCFILFYCVLEKHFLLSFYHLNPMFTKSKYFSAFFFFFPLLNRTFPHHGYRAVLFDFTIQLIFNLLNKFTYKFSRQYNLPSDPKPRTIRVTKNAGTKQIPKSEGSESH